MGDELVDLGHAHFSGVSFVMIEDVLANPFDVGFFGARGVLFEANEVSVLVKEFLGLGFSWVLGLVHILAPFLRQLYNQFNEIYRILYSGIAVYTPKLGFYPTGTLQHAV